MACSKYTLTNTGTTAVNFNYRRCDDSMWEYQVPLQPNQTKTIWLINGTYSAAPLFQPQIVLTNLGAYPIVYPTPTPSPTVTTTPTTTPTPSVTVGLTPTMTPSNTASPTLTQTLTTTVTSSVTPTVTKTPTTTVTPSVTPTLTQTPTVTTTITSSVTPSVTPSVTTTNTPSVTTTNTPTVTTTNTVTPTNTPTPTKTPQVVYTYSGLNSDLSAPSGACAGPHSTSWYGVSSPTFNGLQVGDAIYNDPNLISQTGTIYLSNGTNYIYVFQGFVQTAPTPC